MPIGGETNDIRFGKNPKRNIKPFYNINVNEINTMIKNGNFTWFYENSDKFIKEVKIWKTSYNELIKMLKTNNLHNDIYNNHNEIIRKRCFFCKRLFKCKNILIVKLIARAKTVLNTNEKDLIKLYIKDKCSIIVNDIQIQNTNDNTYDWGKQCYEHFYFNSPQEILKYCCSLRYCSSQCALNVIKNKSQEEIFDGNDILHTPPGIEYKVILDKKKKVKIKILEKIINISFGTSAFG